MDLGLDGLNALVTGSSKGIGLAVAKTLAEEGCNVHLTARTGADLEQAKAEIAKVSNRSVEIHPTDLSNSSNIPPLLEACGPLDILVNNAGAIPGGDIEAVDEARWREAWDLKVFGYVNMTRQVYAAMKAGKGGTIVNVIGLAGERPWSTYIAGAAGNSGLIGFTRAMGGSSLADGIRVVAVNPGLVETERMTTLLRTRAESELGDPERWREFMKDAPLGRAASAQEVANAVVFLASGRSSFTSGTTLSIDGGISYRSPPM